MYNRLFHLNALFVKMCYYIVHYLYLYKHTKTTNIFSFLYKSLVLQNTTVMKITEFLQNTTL